VLLTKKSDKSGNVEKEIRELSKKISYGFMTEKVEELISNKDFKSLLLIKRNNVNYNNDVFVNHVNNMNYEDLLANLKDKSFVKILSGQIGYEKKTDIKFKKFSHEENMNVSEVLLSLYDKEKATERYRYNFLYFFAEENRGFIKEFAIKKLPDQIFYGWDFMPKGIQFYDPSNFISDNYSNQEIYQAFQNMEKMGGIFSEMGVNSKYDAFFQHAFFEERRSRKSEGSDSSFLSFLEFAKEKDNVLYAMMAYSQIWEATLDYGRNYEDKTMREYKSRDEAINAYFNKNFDLDLVLEGLSKIIKKMKDAPSNYEEEGTGINRKIASYCITATVHNTYYEEYDDTNYGVRGEYNSKTSEADTLKIMKFLYKNAPLHLIERHVIGKAKDTVNFFENNIEHFCNFEDVKNFLLPDPKVETEYLRLDEKENTQRTRLLGFTKAIIEYAVEKQDHQTVDFIKHLVTQHQFLKKEMNYKMQNKAYEGTTPMFIEVVAEDKEICSMLEKAKIKMNLHAKLEKKTSLQKKNNKI
jgi:hypothetical protein